MTNENPNQGAPQGGKIEPLGDLGERGKTWSPAQGEQGISNRAGDEEERKREEKGNRGPDEEPGFGQGA
jgi:hypothetical protein